MVVRFTPEQIVYLKCLKDSGHYQKNEDQRTHSDTLFDVLAEGCRIKSIRFFRSRHFLIEYPCNRSDTDRRRCGCHSDMSELLSRGEILFAIRYGNKVGLIEKVSSYRWGFTKL